MPTTRKLGVFVGSTQAELSEIRERIIESILRAGHIPNVMELWPSGHVQPWQVIEDQLQLCDVHLVLIGSHYGQLMGDISFTHKEYKTSKSAGRPVIPFILNDTEFDAAVKAPEHPEDESKVAKLCGLREQLREDAMCREFSLKNPTGIASDCVNAINEADNSGRLAPEAGWIRASSERARQLRAIEKNTFLQRILQKVHSFSTLSERLEDEVPAKEFLGWAFWEIMLGRIKRSDYLNIFFESGSTVAYVSDAFEKKVLASEGDATKWQITTNNALSLLQLLLHTHFDVKPQPAGAPEDYYGAMFNSVLLRHPEAAPSVPRSLFDMEREAVRDTQALLRPLATKDNNKNHLFLAAASGVDLDNEVEDFRGPHVGSHPNMLFKRAIFATQEPIVLFLTSHKIGRAFEVDKCFPVFGPDSTWQSACENSKLAIAIGYEPMNGDPGPENVEAERHRILEQLESADVLRAFDTEYAIRESPKAGAMIIANNQFKSVFREE